MHEMSIAEGILDIVLETMKNNDASIVHSVQLDLGLMSGVEPDALLGAASDLSLKLVIIMPQ